MKTYSISWIDWDGREWEKIVYAENRSKAKYKAFKLLRDIDGIFEPYANFWIFLKYYFKDIKEVID